MARPALLLLARRRTASTARLQSVLMTLSTVDTTVRLLAAHAIAVHIVGHPRIVEYLIQRGAFLGVNLQHPANNVSRFSWQKSK